MGIHPRCCTGALCVLYQALAWIVDEHGYNEKSNRDVSEFLREIEQCIPALRRYAFALLRDTDRADDLVQDCLERAMRKRLLWRRGSSMRAWLFTMLHNVHVNQLRKRANLRVSVLEDDDWVTHLEPRDADSLMGDIVKCLEKLSEEQRQVLLLVALEGFSYKEVSKILKLPMGTVMSRLSRAREAMKKLMDGEPGPQLRRVK